MNTLPRPHETHSLDFVESRATPFLKPLIISQQRRAEYFYLEIAFLVCFALFLVPSAAQATLVTYSASLEFSGGKAPTGPTPWVTVVADDGGGVGSVLLTMTATNLTTHGSNT